MSSQTDVSRYIGALSIAIEGEDGRTNVEFLGTVFSISEEHRLFMTARHIVPDNLDTDLGRVAVTLKQPDGQHAFWVEEVEGLDGQADVAILRVERGVEHLFGLAPRPASVLEEVYSIGVPDSLVERRDPGLVLRQRAIRGIVTRRLEVGEELHAGYTAPGPSYEIDTAIPTGMSGAPVFALSMGRQTDLVGLVGVCLGSIDSYTTLWSVEMEPGRQSEGHRVIQFGLVARLFPQHSAIVRMVDLPLERIVGHASGRVALFDP